MSPPDPKGGRRLTGRVRYWHETKKFGRIAGDDGLEYFAHWTEVANARRLRIGDEVTFRATDKGRGPRAIEVRVLEVSRRQ